MRVTLTANGYQGLRCEVTEVLEDGARVTLERKGVDLAPRIIFFTWDAIKGGKIDMPEVPKVIRKFVADLKPGDTVKRGDRWIEIASAVLTPKATQVRIVYADGERRNYRTHVQVEAKS